MSMSLTDASREFADFKDAVLREMLQHRLEPDVICCLRDMLQFYQLGADGKPFEVKN
jgi:hypothetical protein